MRVAIRTDSSLDIGTGHVARCLTLAQRLRDKGALVEFVCRDHPSNIMHQIEERGFAVFRLRKPGRDDLLDSDQDGYSQWLGVSQQVDAEQTARVLRVADPYSWLIVDHYGLDARWELEMRDYADKILAIDDLANRSHACDVLLDQNLFSESDLRYDGKVPDRCTRMLGPSYAILRREYARLRKSIVPRKGRVARVLIFFGGIDRTGETLKACNAICDLGRQSLTVDVVVGSANPRREEISAWCGTHLGFIYHCQVQDMARLMATADLAIGAAGTATWERCCLGLPTILMAVADNQIPIAREISSAGAGLYLGTPDYISQGQIAAAVRKMLDNPELVRDISERAMQLVDGRGSDRIINLMLSRRGAEVTL
jgi:UDP-2,4-diacetamido-2,4,6-trideoxy-beta-L-altropyranose hydrolase